MATYINAATAGNFATVMLNINDGTNAPVLADFVSNAGVIVAGTLDIPALQDITVTNNAGTFRWRQLDALSEKVVSTVSTNNITGNLVVDPVTFFGDGTTPIVTAEDAGLFNLSNNKTKVDFIVFLSGYSNGDRYIMGSGYITNIAPAVSADSPVWVSPFTIEVDGDYKPGIVSGITPA